MVNNESNRRSLGVHTLSEFVFCPKAGLISYGENKQDRGFEKSVSNLNYTPFYEIREIDEAFYKLQKNTVQMIALWLGLTVISLAALFLANWEISAVMAALSGIPFFVLVGLVFRAYQLIEIRKGFLECNIQTPDLTNDEVELLDWRKIIAGNFDLISPVDAFRCEQLMLAGKPWKLLTRGRLCVPVFRCLPTRRKNPASHAPENWMYDQHLIRISAYCQLIESQTSNIAPFGIVLFSGTFRAFVIKPTAASNGMLVGAIEKANTYIELFESGEFIPADPDARICKGCIRGKLRERCPGLTDVKYCGKESAPNIVTRNGKFVHSQCGDLFNWSPPTHRITPRKK